MRSGEGDYFTPTPKYHNPIWMVGMVSPFIYFLFFLSEEDIIGSQYCLEQGAWSCPCPSFTRKKKTWTNKVTAGTCLSRPQITNWNWQQNTASALTRSHQLLAWLSVCVSATPSLALSPGFLHTWTAEVEVAVAPPGRKTFFWTFGAINLLESK